MHKLASAVHVSMKQSFSRMSSKQCAESIPRLAKGYISAEVLIMFRFFGSHGIAFLFSVTGNNFSIISKEEDMVRVLSILTPRKETVVQEIR